jgi:pimeloyl-ACP methyl ester carboxylesterase
VTAHSHPHAASFQGASGNRLAADIFGKTGRPVLMLHGGGQTRHAWRKTAAMIAGAGMVATAVDQRGHGDSEWVADGAYGFPDFAADARALGEHVGRAANARPVAIGASLGGIACLLAAGDAEVFSALVLVDITPRVDLGGVAKVQGFMRAHAREGFGSVEEAADAVAAYLPHRPRPRSNEGLKKNLRLHPDGRWRWHWDPRFLDGRRPVDGRRAEVEDRMIAVARGLTIPTLLVRGGSSELVQEAHAREFLDLVPHAKYADVTGARHMVAGDRNDEFATAIMNFLNEI